MLISLETRAKKSIEFENNLSALIKKHYKTVSYNNLAGSLWYDNEVLFVYEFKQGAFYQCKSRCFTCGLMDQYQILNFNGRIFDYGLNHISYALLSDNKAFLQAYANLRYQRGRNAELSMDEMVAEGESPIWCNTVQQFITGDQAAIERNLNILETRTLPHLRKDEKELRFDYQFYRALYERNKGAMEAILEQLVSPAIHRRRNEDAVLSQYISHPALGYAKLAWRAGIPVEVNSPLVPRELLPIRPLSDYPLPYDFLREDYTPPSPDESKPAGTSWWDKLRPWKQK